MKFHPGREFSKRKKNSTKCDFSESQPVTIHRFVTYIKTWTLFFTEQKWTNVLTDIGTANEWDSNDN